MIHQYKHLAVLIALSLLCFGCGDDNKDTKNNTDPSSTQTDPGHTGTTEDPGHTGTEDPNHPGQTQTGNPRTCGSETCTGNQLCLNNHCVDRNQRAVAGETCTKETFLESCDGNQLVYCSCTDTACVTEVADCESDTCALHASRNYAFCVKPDNKCTSASAGEMTYCYLPAGFINAYLEKFECAMATDGKYYPFRLEHETIDCVGTCLDNYSCNLNDEPCDPATFESKCENDIAVMCSDEHTVYRLNCQDYEVGCIMGDEGATCNW